MEIFLLFKFVKDKKECIIYLRDFQIDYLGGWGEGNLPRGGGRGNGGSNGGGRKASGGRAPGGRGFSPPSNGDDTSVRNIIKLKVACFS